MEHPVREWRLYVGLTQAELARAAGVAPLTIYRIENGYSKTSHKTTLKALADVLGCEPDELVAS